MGSGPWEEGAGFQGNESSHALGQGSTPFSGFQ